jgi:hypothetical protein
LGWVFSGEGFRETSSGKVSRKKSGSKSNLLKLGLVGVEPLSRADCSHQRNPSEAADDDMI